MIIKDRFTNDSGRLRHHRSDDRSPLQVLPVGIMIMAFVGVIIMLASIT